MDYSSLLNERQLEAVSTKSKYTRIVAGAGSGKTRVLTYRISYLIGEMGVKPSSIVAIAFTNKVAGEMKNRALKLLDGNVKGLHVSTFHSYCASFLRKEIDAIGYPANFTIMDEDDQVKLIKDIGVSAGYKRNDDIVKRTISFIGFNKTKGIYPDDVRVQRDSSEEYKTMVKFYHIYEAEKERMQSLDFDDLLLKTIEILSEFPDIRKKWQNSISNILVDEFQDTNDVQYKLIKLLMNENTSLYVVGDPDQTIYTWRGANQDIILNFQRDYPLAETIILDRNYRSTKNILNRANKLISYNKKRVHKDLYTNNTSGAEVTARILFSREKEAQYVLDKIQEIMHKDPSVKYSDFAILYRAAYLTLPFENELMKRRIPYKIYGGIKFYQRKEVKDVLAYFRLILNSEDDISFERIINVPKRGIGETTLNLLKLEKNAAGLSYYNYLKNIEKYNSELKSKHFTSLTFMIEKIETLREKLKENVEAYPDLLEGFIRDIGYYQYLSNDDDGDERLKNVKTLFDNIIDYLKHNPDSKFEDYLADTSLQSSQDEIDDEDHVNLMTIHVAKGLEFDYVFVVSLIDGVFPSERTVFESEDGLEEERRLCYVAFTRAKKQLFATANESYSFILSDKAKRSQFFEEAELEVNDGYTERFKARSKPLWANNPLFDDYSFEEKPKPAVVAHPESNGITSWMVGDRIRHDKFGEGVVTTIIDDTIIEVEFDSVGKKSLMASHYMIHKIEEGGDA